MRKSLGFVAAAIMFAALLTVGSSPADADGHLEVIVDGLDNPRGISVKGADIYVAEAGRGGDTLVEVAIGGGPGPVCVGDTGAITRITGGAVTSRVSLPSYVDAVDGACEGDGFGINATGPHGVAFVGRNLTYTVGLGGNPTSRSPLEAASASAELLGSINGSRGGTMASLDLAAYEDANDPDGEGADSNPYGLAAGRGVSAFVADAGANALLEVRARSTEVVAVMAPRCVPFLLGPNPIPDPFNPCGDSSLFPAQAVPTAVAMHPDGDYLVTTLGGFPFTPGESVVYKVDAAFDGTATCSSSFLAEAEGCEVFADGLTALVGIDVDKNGRVYVVQLADAGLLALFGGADAGSVQVFDGDSGELVGSIDGLNAPGGIDIVGRSVYLTNNSTGVGTGELLRTDLVE